MDGRGHPRRDDRPCRGLGSQEREGDVARAHRSGRQGRDPRRRGGDLPHPRPGGDPAALAGRTGEAGLSARTGGFLDKPYNERVASTTES